MSFLELIIRAKSNLSYEEEILEMYRPLLIKESIQQGVFDEDLYQELVIVLVRCIRTFII